MTVPPNAIIVGIDTHGAGAAIRFALDEARRTDRPVHLVHLLHIPTSEFYATVYADATRRASSVLDAALAETLKLAEDDVVVTGEVVESTRVRHELVSLTDPHRLLVLQHQHLGRLDRALSGSVVQSVAARASGPVVSVPEEWTPRTDDPAVVTAAVQDPVEAPGLLRAAFEEARTRGAQLVVLHAWWLSSGYDEALAADFVSDWSQRSIQELDEVLTPLGAEFPDVPARVQIRHAPPAGVVLEAATKSSLLVLGRRHHLMPLGTHLGPVARAAIGHAEVPVLITPELG